MGIDGETRAFYADSRLRPVMGSSEFQERSEERAHAAGAASDPERPDYSGALIALDPRNGDVFAMVSQPAYDPNAFAGGINAEMVF